MKMLYALFLISSQIQSGFEEVIEKIALFEHKDQASVREKVITSVQNCVQMVFSATKNREDLCPALSCILDSREQKKCYANYLMGLKETYEKEASQGVKNKIQKKVLADLDTLKDALHSPIKFFIDWEALFMSTLSEENRVKSFFSKMNSSNSDKMITLVKEVNQTFRDYFAPQVRTCFTDQAHSTPLGSDSSPKNPIDCAFSPSPHQEKALKGKEKHAQKSPIHPLLHLICHPSLDRDRHFNFESWSQSVHEAIPMNVKQDQLQSGNALARNIKGALCERGSAYEEENILFLSKWENREHFVKACVKIENWGRAGLISSILEETKSIPDGDFFDVMTASMVDYLKMHQEEIQDRLMAVIHKPQDQAEGERPRRCLKIKISIEGTFLREIQLP